MSRNSFTNSYTRWSIRRLSVGVASVVVASGFFVLLGGPVVQADQVVPERTAVEMTVPKSSEESVLSQSAPVAEPVAMTPDKEVSTSVVEHAVPVSETVTTPSDKVVPSSSSENMEATPEVARQDKPQSETATPIMVEQAMAEAMTSPEQVKRAVTENVKEETEVPASYLEKANVPGPFLAGVNQVIPYEAFGGDGMLTRLLLKSSDMAPWSDNGVAKNPALLPLENLGHGQYFYEVDLNGNTTGKDGQVLLDQLRMNGTQAYMATVKVYGAKDGKADLTNLVASRGVTVNLNGVTTAEQVKQAISQNLHSSIKVPTSYLEKANVPGPFLAGVNQVIPFEFFGGDGMLTRLLLKASDMAPWSDNGVATNPALLPLGKLGHGQYFYEVDLNGNTTGKDGQALLDQLRMNGSQAYMATVKVYGAKDGKADLTNLVASRDVMINLNQMVAPMSEKPMKEHVMMQSQNNMSNKKSEMMMSNPHRSQQAFGMNMTNSMKSFSSSKQGMVAHAGKDEKMMAKMDKMTLPNTGEGTNNLSGLGVLGLVVAGFLSVVGLKKKEESN